MCMRWWHTDELCYDVECAGDGEVGQCQDCATKINVSSPLSLAPAAEHKARPDNVGDQHYFSSCD